MSLAKITYLAWDTVFSRPLPLTKRLVDIALASGGLLVLSPVMLLVAVVIKLTSKGPVFFAQERTGQDRRRFRMYKFRTMKDGAYKELHLIKDLNLMTGPLIKVENDPRLTCVGGFLRKTSLDELPQLFNVLRGDMTLVGPRALSPLPVQYERWQTGRFVVRPGIACAWQAYRRADSDFVEWMRSDLSYLDRSSLLTDLRILTRTIVNVLLGKGAR
jgi:lipopolysaccharide/colanic/teichoic acid biosynthesis glycosyltransferase